MLLAAAILLLITGITWAHFAILDEVKRGQGRVVPSRQMQVLQSLEGGLIEDIAVRKATPFRRARSSPASTTRNFRPTSAKPGQSGTLPTTA